jgi:hypothetical protein
MNITHGSILAVFFTASETEKHEGLSWYARANIVASRLAIAYDVPGGAPTVAGVIAALSPNNRWERNVADAERLIKASACGDDTDVVKVCTFSKNKEKALAILNGTPALEVLGGNKVRAFYQCIAQPAGDAVCVDGHAYSIWLGERVPTTKTPSISDKLYDRIANDYRLAAEQINNITKEYYSASQVQAITWVTWRNLFNNDNNN